MIEPQDDKGGGAQLQSLIRDYTGDVDPDTGLPLVDRDERLPEAKNRKRGELLNQAHKELTTLIMSYGVAFPLAQAMAAAALLQALPDAARTDAQAKAAALKTRFETAAVALQSAGSISAVDSVTL